MFSSSNSSSNREIFQQADCAACQQIVLLTSRLCCLPATVISFCWSRGKSANINFCVKREIISCKFTLCLHSFELHCNAEATLSVLGCKKILSDITGNSPLHLKFKETRGFHCAQGQMNTMDDLSWILVPFFSILD